MRNIVINPGGPVNFSSRKAIPEIHWLQTHLSAHFIASWCTEYCFGGITL